MNLIQHRDDQRKFLIELDRNELIVMYLILGMAYTNQNRTPIYVQRTVPDAWDRVQRLMDQIKKKVTP